MIDQTEWASVFEFIVTYSTVGMVVGLVMYLVGYATAAGKIHGMWLWARGKG